MEDFDENSVSIDELKSIFKYYDEEIKPSPPVMQTLLLVRLLMRKIVQKRNHWDGRIYMKNNNKTEYFSLARKVWKAQKEKGIPLLNSFHIRDGEARSSVWQVGVKNRQRKNKVFFSSWLYLHHAFFSPRWGHAAIHEMKACYYRRGYCEMLIAAKITDGSAFQLLFSDILSKRSSQNRSTEL